MIKFIKNTLFSLIQKKDSFLVVEINKEGARLSKISVVLGNASIIVEKSKKVEVNDSLLKEFKKLDDRKSRIILVLDSNIGFTVYSKIGVMLRSSIDQEDNFENISTEALHKLFENTRGVVAQKLNIANSDVTLLDARILSVESASQVISNSLEMYCTITCIAKNWVQEIFKILPVDRVVMCVEGVAAFGRVVSHILKYKNCLFSYIASRETTVVAMNGFSIEYLDYFLCGAETVLNELVLQQKFPNHLVQYAINSYHNKIGSATFLDNFGKSLISEYKIIENGLGLIIGKSNLKFLYLASGEIVPDFVVKARIKNKSGHFIKILTISHSFISTKLGFEVKYKVEESGGNFQVALASLFDFYLSPQNELFSKISKRKVKWLNQYVG